VGKRRIAYIVFTILIALGFAALGWFVFSKSYLRLIESFVDFGKSIGYYFCEIFGISHNIVPTVGDYSNIFGNSVDLPVDVEGFKGQSANYLSLLFSFSNFKGWLSHILGGINSFSKNLMLFLPAIVGVIILIKGLYARGNNNYNHDTLPLRVFKGVAKFTYQPIKSFVRGYVAFIRQHGWIYKCWVVLWILQLNLATIVVEAFAYYFYFVVSFDFGTLYIQFAKLFIDLQVLFTHFPWWTLVTAAILLFCRFREKIALNTLRHFEANNCGFINELPIVSITCGSMGKKKTTMITDMALSQEVMFRQKAMDILQENDMKFPHFPWICFENDIQKAMADDSVYNLATVKEWVKNKAEQFEENVDKGLIYGYDYRRYGLEYNDGLKVSNLFEVLETYAQAYFIYVISSSLIVSNYSIRTDATMIDEGNFPLWLTDFYSKNARPSRHAKILDFDTLRLGKKVIENNPNIGSFEFGVVCISEVGKERGNNLELKEVKKGKDETNQKNDLFNSWLKMCRHSATVDNYPFIKVFTDEQRPESWGADARDLCDIVSISSSSEMKLALPFYTIEEMISEWAFNKFINLYYDFRFRRGDNTLLVHILKSITACLWKHNARIYNKFGYCVLTVNKERGTMDGKVDEKKYYICSYKTYRKRFATDCFSDYFNDLAKRTKIGLADYLEYATERATIDELKLQNSYFVNSLYKTQGDENND
jgi:hypothetical protein